MSRKGNGIRERFLGKVQEMTRRGPRDDQERTRKRNKRGQRTKLGPERTEQKQERDQKKTRKRPAQDLNMYINC
jgi:hypothetical protein